jgi:hypothetical protein
MYDQTQFEIPAGVRDLAERNVVQVRQAYEQFLGLVTKAQETILKSQGAITTSVVEIQAKVLHFAQANIEANFRFATDIAKARDVKEYLDVQSRYAQSQLESYAKQGQEITRLMGAAAHKSQPRA